MLLRLKFRLRHHKTLKFEAAAGASRYTQIDTSDNDTGVTVTCNGADCDKLKAFIVSWGSAGDANTTAVATVTGVCPLDDNDSSDPSSCWVDDVSVDEDGNVGTVPLQWGFNRVDWVAADDYGNLILSTMKTQYIYVAPALVLTGGATDFVVAERGPNTITTAELDVQFSHDPDVHDPDGDGSVQFLDGVERDIPTPPIDELPNCTFTGSNPYTYTVTVPAVGAPATVCTVFDDVRQSSGVVTFGTLPTPFYAVGNPITVERANETTNRVALARIGEIEVHPTGNSDINFLAVALGARYQYEVEIIPSGNAEVEITLIPEDVDVPVASDGTFMIPISASGDDPFISIEVTIAGTSITHTVEYPIVDNINHPLAAATDDDNDGVPDSNDAMLGPSDDGDNTFTK